MSQYTVFFSWQSDNDHAGKQITKALKSAVKSLENRDRKISISQDSRDPNGAENISVGLLESIDRSDLFIADITPVSQYAGKDGVKLTPNSNVIFELGYAIARLGESRCKQITFLAEGQSMPMMPFDINQRKTLIIKDANTSGLEKRIAGWLNDKLDEIDRDRVGQRPEQLGTITFENDRQEITIHPEFERITYSMEDPVSRPAQQRNPIDTIVKGSVAPGFADDVIARLNSIRNAKCIPVKPVTETIYESRVPIRLKLTNGGTTPLDNIHIHIKLSSDSGATLYEDNKKTAYPLIVSKQKYGSISVNDNGDEAHLVIETLNPEMCYILDEFYLLTPPIQADITLKWSINCRNYSNDGDLTIYSDPQYRDIRRKCNARFGKTDYNEIITSL